MPDVVKPYFCTERESRRCIVNWIPAYAVICTMLFFLLLYSAGAGIKTFRSRRDSSAEIAAKKNIEAYCINHADSLYIYDSSVSYATDPFQTYPDKKPVNLLFWGGSGAYFPMYYEQLAQNGYDEMYSEQFFEEGIFFVGACEPHQALTEYMDTHYPGCTCTVMEVFDDFIVYRFDRRDDDEKLW